MKRKTTLRILARSEAMLTYADHHSRTLSLGKRNPMSNEGTPWFLRQSFGVGRSSKSSSRQCPAGVFRGARRLHAASPSTKLPTTPPPPCKMLIRFILHLQNMLASQSHVLESCSRHQSGVVLCSLNGSLLCRAWTARRFFTV